MSDVLHYFSLVLSVLWAANNAVECADRFSIRRYPQSAARFLHLVANVYVIYCLFIGAPR